MRYISLLNIFLLISLTVIISACTPSATEKPLTNQGETLHFNNLDRNKDEVLTLDELPQNHELNLHFDHYDLNHDGKISAYEFREYLKTLP